MHSLILQNINSWKELSPQIPLTDDFAITLSLIPNALLRSLGPQEGTGIFLARLRTEEHREAISAHLIYLLENNCDNLKILPLLLEEVTELSKRMNLGDEESPLGQAILQYQVLLADKQTVTPWTIYNKHKERLNSPEKLPYPALGNSYFNYEALASTKEITPDMLPKGIGFTNLKALTAAFVERYNKLDSRRKEAIDSYLNTVLPDFVTIENLVRTIDDPWWNYRLRASTPISETTWKLFNAVAYICKESNEAGTELPGVEDTSANFLLKEKLLSPQESALLKLLGQVQNCNSGKEWGLELFSQFMSSTLLPTTGDAQERISEAIRNYLQQIIYSDAFLKKVLNGESTGGQPLHYSKYICNALSKELQFPIKFDPHTGAIGRNSVLHKKTHQQLLTAVFKEVKPVALYKYVLDSLNELDWSSKEGQELYYKLKQRAPPRELEACCNFDEDGMLIGVTIKAVPYLLKQYGFLTETPVKT